METANELGARFVATGHYAKILLDEGVYHLLKAEDAAKDQSYFLFSHTQATLARTLFPLELLTKTQVRDLARLLRLPVAEKPESQEICFVSQGRYDKYIDEIGAAPRQGPGPIRHVDGAILGQHKGYWRFTLGQRKGLGIAHARPLYVTAIDPLNQTVWVGEEEHLFQTRLKAREASWCQGTPAGPFPCLAKLRSRSPEVPAWVEPLDDGGVQVVFETPQRAITPGQAVVFYDEREVLGGAWIQRS
jgi:tRNA-specific 2-thiouridylase